MMAKAHEVAIGADGRAFDQGIRSGVIKPTEDAVKALGKLEDAASDAGRDGSRDLDRLEDELKDVQRQSEKTERSVDDIGDGSRRGFGRASEATSEFKDEARANFSEVTSSFDGSMSSIQDLAQGTLGGLASTGLPGVGIAAGIAAVGIGAIGAAFGEAEEERKRLEERASSLAQAYIEAGSQVLDAITIASQTSAILTSTDPATKKDLEDLTTALGSQTLAARVLAGDTNALATAQSLAAKAQAELDRLSPQQIANTGKRKTEISQEAEAYQFLVDKVRQQTTVSEEAQAALQAQSDILLSLADDAGTATEEVDEFGNRLLTLPKGDQIVISAETGLATANIQAFKGEVGGVKETVTTTALFDDAEARRKYAEFRALVNQRLGITAQVNTVGPILRWD